VLLINAVKDVASSLNELVVSTKLAASKQSNEIENLKEAAKNMVTNVQSLLKTVKTVEDDTARGTRAVESAVEAIAQEIKTFSNTLNPSSDTNTLHASATTDDLIRAARQITIATSKTVGAGTTCKQEDMIVAANMSRKAVSDLLTVCRGLLIDAETNGLNPNMILNVGYTCATSFKDLLDCLSLVIIITTTNKNRLGYFNIFVLFCVFLAEHQH
jgi:talin